MHLAAIHGHLDVIQFLAGRGAELNVKRYDGFFTALYLAIAYEPCQVVQFLQEQGALVEKNAWDLYRQEPRETLFFSPKDNFISEKFEESSNHYIDTNENTVPKEVRTSPRFA